MTRYLGFYLQFFKTTKKREQSRNKTDKNIHFLLFLFGSYTYLWFFDFIHFSTFLPNFLIPERCILLNQFLSLHNGDYLFSYKEFNHLFFMSVHFKLSLSCRSHCGSLIKMNHFSKPTVLSTLNCHFNLDCSLNIWIIFQLSNIFMSSFIQFSSALPSSVIMQK